MTASAVVDAGGGDGELVAWALLSVSGLTSRVAGTLPTSTPATMSEPGNEVEPFIP
jgi:hypothetical protein